VSSQERETINVFTNKNQVLAIWKKHFEENISEGSESEQPTRPVDLRDDGIDIDLPSREKIEGALKYLKNNKAAGADFTCDTCSDSAGLDWRDTTEKQDRGDIVSSVQERAINSIVKTIAGFAS
jgi:hypothetical protein